MSTTIPWNPLLDALDAEVALLRELLSRSVAAQEPLTKLDVPAVETWAVDHRQLLGRLNECSKQRASVQEQCLPASIRGVAGPGPVAQAITLHALSQRAPAPVGKRLRQRRDTLRGLRDEVALVASRNEVLIRQVIDFTVHLGESLVAANADNSYDAEGQHNESGATGALYRRAL